MWVSLSDTETDNESETVVEALMESDKESSSEIVSLVEGDGDELKDEV